MTWVFSDERLSDWRDPSNVHHQHFMLRASRESDIKQKSRDPCVQVVASLSNMNPYELLNPVPICSNLCHGHGSRWASLQDPLSQLSTTTIVCLETAGQQRLQSSHVKFAVEERLKTVQNGRRTATATASLASTCSVVNVTKVNQSRKFNKIWSISISVATLQLAQFLAAAFLQTGSSHHFNFFRALHQLHPSIPTHPHPRKFRALGGSPCLRRQSRHMPFHLWARTRSWLPEHRATAVQSEVMSSQL